MADPWDNDPIAVPATGAASPWANDPVASSQPGFIERAGKWLATRALEAAPGMAQTAQMAIAGPMNTSLLAAYHGSKRDKSTVERLLLDPAGLARDEAYKAGFKKTDLPGNVGKVVDKGTEAVISSLMFPGATSWASIIPNAVGGMTSEVAGQATEGTKFEQAARFFGGLGGGMAAGVPFMVRPTAGSMVAKASEGITPQQWQAGRQMQADATARGVPLMAHESIPGVDASHPLAQLFGHVAASPAGAPIRKTAADRIPGIRAAIGRQADDLAPAIVDPKKVDIQLAEAADAAVRAPKTERAAEATPAYAAARPTGVDEAIPKQIVGAIDEALAKVNPAGTAATRLREMRAMVVRGGSDPMPKVMDADIAGFKLPDATKARMMRDRYPIQPPTYETNVGRLDEVFKQFDELIKQRAFDPTKSLPETARVEMQPIIGNLRMRLMQANADYRKGVEVYKGAGGKPSPWTEAVTEAERSGVGQIASAYGGKPDQASRLFGKWIMDPDHARPDTIRADIARLNKQDPAAARAAFRLYVENAADAAFEPTRGMPAVYSGSNFAKTVAGRPMARENLLAAAEAVTGNKTTAAGFAKLVDILQATGITPGIGSPTATRTAAQQQAGNSGVLGAAIDTANLMRGSALYPMRERVRELRFGKVFGELADLTTTPEGVRKLHELALLNPQSAKAKAIAASLLQGMRGAQEGVKP